jgi:hypothetical protein
MRVLRRTTTTTAAISVRIDDEMEKHRYARAYLEPVAWQDSNPNCSTSRQADVILVIVERIGTHGLILTLIRTPVH